MFEFKDSGQSAYAQLAKQAEKCAALFPDADVFQKVLQTIRDDVPDVEVM
jgi:predicted ATPase